MSFPDYVVKPAPGMVVKKNNGVRRVLAVDGLIRYGRNPVVGQARVLHIESRLPPHPLAGRMIVLHVHDDARTHARSRHRRLVSNDFFLACPASSRPRPFQSIMRGRLK